MKTLTILFLALFLFSCANSSEKNTEKPKTEIENISENSKNNQENTSKNSEWEIHISDNFTVTSTKKEDDFSKHLSKDTVILHFSAQDSKVLYHFSTIKDFYDFIPLYIENVKKWDEYKMQYFSIDTYGLFEQYKETKDLYSQKILTDIFAVLEKYPNLQNSLDIRIDDEFLEYAEVRNWYEKFLKK